MAIQVRATPTGQIYIANGIYKRAIASEAERQALIAMGLVPAVVQTVAQAVLDNMAEVSNVKSSPYL